MSETTGQQKVLGWAVTAIGLFILGVAMFADNEGFNAPRSVVAGAGLAFLLGGVLALRAAMPREPTRPDTLSNACGATIVLLFGVIPLWLAYALGPEATESSGSLVLQWLPWGIGDIIENALFYGILGITGTCFTAIGLHGWMKTLAAAGIAWRAGAFCLLIALAVWAASEWTAEARLPRQPLLELSFERDFPSEGQRTKAYGKQIEQRPGPRGQALFIGGHGDWLDFELPQEVSVPRSMTLEFWVKREQWINPYRNGSGSQTVLSLEYDKSQSWFAQRFLKRNRAVEHLSFSLNLSVSREHAHRGHNPAYFNFRPRATFGDTRLTRIEDVKLAADKWVYVALVYDRLWIDRMRLYLDGKLVARGVPQGSAPRLDSLRTLRLGTWHERNQAFRGSIDELKLYGRALSDAEIAAHAMPPS